jgi:hypothetical protein
MESRGALGIHGWNSEAYPAYMDGIQMRLLKNTMMEFKVVSMVKKLCNVHGYESGSCGGYMGKNSGATGE